MVYNVDIVSYHRFYLLSCTDTHRDTHRHTHTHTDSSIYSCIVKMKTSPLQLITIRKVKTMFFDRPGVAGAVLQTALLLIN